jgi:hypothetical protein
MTMLGECCLLLGLRFCVPFGRMEGGGWEALGDIGLREGPVKVCFLGLVCAPCLVEGVEHCPVVGEDIEDEEIVGSIAPGATID